MTCNCSPSSNITCLSFGEENLYGVAQPTCVILPDDTTENNPFYDSVNNIAYWAYKVYASCEITNIITDIYIPVFENIAASNLTVFERILSCGRFENVAYDFEPPTGITPPENLQFVHIPVDDRFNNSASVYYRLAVTGDFPPAQETIYLQTSSELITLDGNFLIPGEPEAPNLGLTKDSEVVIVNNEAIINYTVNVTNTGNTNLENIQYTDTINYDGSNVTIGVINVTPDDIVVDTSTSGIIRLTGNLGDLAMGESTQVVYSVPIISFNAPSNYIFNSATMVTSADVITNINTLASVEVVQFATSTACNVLSNNSANFVASVSSVGNSPEAETLIQNIIAIPSGVTVRFTSFNNCMAMFLDTLEPVSLNTDITNRDILLSCTATITPNSIMNYTFEFIVSSTTSFGSGITLITSSLEAVILTNPESQITLGASPLPNVVSLEAGGETICNGPCTPPINL